MSTKKYTIRRPSHSDYSEIMKRDDTCNPLVSDFRNTLDNIHTGCHVSSESTHQCGTVLDVVRDRYGISAAIKVEYEDESGRLGVDYIPAPSVCFWEPFNFYVPNDEYEDGFDTSDEYFDEDEENFE